ncbi:MarR family winged helix-turn-helix transcriptional regulator [Actibacterium mucosum]|nr:MarR family transcriptional regulator [Actibacterium mucosum]
MLMTLAEIAPARLHQLVEQMARDKSQITRQVKVLEGKGLITRAPDPDDARGWVLSLSPLGETFVAELEHAVADALSNVLAPLSPQDTETLRNLLARL